jgi:hypothetical protein
VAGTVPTAHDLLARWDAQGGDVALVEALASSGERGAALASVSGPEILHRANEARS